MLQHSDIVFPFTTYRVVYYGIRLVAQLKCIKCNLHSWTRDHTIYFSQPSLPSTSTSTSTSAEAEALAPMSAKRAGKQKQAITSAFQRPQQSASSTTQHSQQTGSGTTTTISSGSEPDHLGLYQMFEKPAATEKPTLSSRLTAASTSGFVGVAAIGEIGNKTTEGGEGTDVEESTGMLKRRCTRDTQSTTMSMQDKKRSKTTMFLKQLQKKAKK